jgi:Tfp pilus assembly protein PilX
MTPILSALRREEGSALVTAIVLTFVMIGLGLAVHAAADTQSAQSGQERVREAAFGVTEAALNAQVFQLSNSFPAQPGTYPATCDPASAGTGFCPATRDFDGYAGGDYDAKCNGAAVTRWTTKVRDNKYSTLVQPQQYYSEAEVENLPRYDANGDSAVWVRADGKAGCRTRSIVTLVKRTEKTIPFTKNVINANAFETTNKGKKVIVDTKGAKAVTAGKVSLRCQPALSTSACAVYERGKGQVSPDTVVAPDPEASTEPLLSGEPLESLKAKARSLGTYYTTCPPSLTGEVVYVESLVGCSVPGGGNSETKPGFLIVNQGTYSIGGNDVFYGTVYMRNASNPPITGQVVKIGGTAAIIGTVAIDGPGTVFAGSSKANIVYDRSAVDNLTGLGAAASVPNTWRELPTRP